MLRQRVPSIRRYLFSRLEDVTSHKTIILLNVTLRSFELQNCVVGRDEAKISQDATLNAFRTNIPFSLYLAAK